MSEASPRPDEMIDLPEPEAATIDGEGESPAPEGADDALLREVRLNPVATSRVLAMLSALATEYGLSEAEQGRVAVFLTDHDLVLATDLDRDVTRTEDGQPRPFRFRFRLPLSDANTQRGRATRLGAWVRISDFLKALRNRVENSEQYGVLDEEPPIRMEVRAGTDDEGEAYPARFVVHPTEDGSLSPRVFETLGGVATEMFDSLETPTADRGIADLDPDALIEMASLTHPDAGVLLDPREPAHLVGVSSRGILLSTLSAPEDLSQQTELFDAVATQEKLDQERRTLDEPVVLSPRLATALGFAQSAMEEAQKAEQRVRTAEQMRAAVVAGLAAALEVADDHDLAAPADVLRRHFGRSLVKKAARRAGRNDEAPAAAVAFATALLDDVPEGDVDALAAAVGEYYDVESALPSGLEGLLREAAGGDQAAATLGGAYLIGRDDLDELLDEVGEAIGEVVLREEARRIIASLPDSAPMESLTHADYAAAAVSLKGRRTRGLMNEVFDSLTDEAAEAWWPTFEERLGDDAVDIEPDAIEALVYEEGSAGQVVRRSGRPNAAAVKIPSSTREGWLERCKRNVHGRMWTSPDGRVYAGFGDEGAGTLTLSDVAVRPDPEQFPLQTKEQAEEAATPGSHYEWKTRVHSDDLQSLADRVVSLSMGREGRDGLSEELGTLFVGRWSPPGEPTREEAVAEVSGDATGVPTTPDDVWLGGGDQARRYRVRRSRSNAVVGDDEAGTLRIFGFEERGEHLIAELPMAEAPRGYAAGRGAGDGDPMAFALDAEQVGHLIAFVTSKGRSVQLSVDDGLARVYDNSKQRIIALPTIEATRVPERLRPLVEAAGVAPERGEPIALAEVYERARALERDAVDGVDRSAVAARSRDTLRPDRLAPEGAIMWDETGAEDEDVEPALGNGFVLDPDAPWERQQTQIRRQIARLERERDGLLDQARTVQRGFALEDEVESEELTETARKARRRIAQIDGQLERLRALKREGQRIAAGPATTGAIRSGSLSALGGLGEEDGREDEPPTPQRR